MSERAYPERPLVGVGGVVLDREGRVLLVKRAREPQRGRWSFPGGLLRLGETAEEGLRREIREETGLEVEVGPLVTAFDRIQRDEDGRVRYHYVILDYLCRAPDGGIPAAASDAEEARFVERESLGELATTPGLGPVVERAARLRRQREAGAEPQDG